MEAIRLVETKDMSREDWLAWRKKGIGGSDTGAILGVNKWKSAIGVWLDKTDQVEEEQEQSEPAYWGNVLEETVAKEFEARTGLKVRRCNAILQHPEIPYMLANVDRLIVGQNVGLECKTTSSYGKDEWESDEVPDSYYIQCQHYMAVTGYDAWWIACLIGGQRFVHKKIERNEELIKMIFERAAAFWKCVEDKIMPATDDTEACAEDLKKLYPKSNGQAIELPETAEIYIKQFEQAAAEEKEVTARKTAAQNALQQMLGEYETGSVFGRNVNWKVAKGRVTFDLKSFEKSYPDLAKPYKKEGKPSRRFSIK